MRRDIGEAYKRPESVLVVIGTRRGEILVLRRGRPPNYWQSVTGSLRESEPPAEAARREVLEETGLRAGKELEDCQRSNRYVIMPHWRPLYRPGTVLNTEHVFRWQIPHRADVTIDGREHVAWRWCPAESAAERVASPTDRQAILDSFETWRSRTGA